MKIITVHSARNYFFMKTV